MSSQRLAPVKDMPISIRPARNEDLEIAAALVQRSINDLWSRHGFEPSMPLRPPVFQAFCLSEDASGLWIAEDGEAIIGFGFSWTLADFWYLAQLFIEPGKQARGVGGELLQKTLLHAERLKAKNRALITFAFNTSAIGLYTKHGLYPRQPLYRISAPASVVQRRLRSSRYACSPIAAGAPVDWLGQIDSDILGFRRDRHHEYLLRTDATGFRIEEGGSAVGYAYASPEGHIGPLAVAPGADSAEVVSAATEAALSLQPQQLSLIAPGGADALMAKVIELGFHIVQPLVLMSARSFGDWRNYVPRDPGYM
jgi:ribosomal protein S18 acetylase RimI-like enzyme